MKIMTPELALERKKLVDEVNRLEEEKNYRWEQHQMRPTGSYNQGALTYRALLDQAVYELRKAEQELKAFDLALLQE